MEKLSQNVDVFNQDVKKYGSYQYTNINKLSCCLATQRTIDLILSTGCFTGQSVLDLGCGDGFYTIHFWDKGKPKTMVGLDASSEAITMANLNKKERLIQFVVGDAHHLPYSDNSFDMVLIQSILHHDDNPEELIREAFRLAPKILIHEPNGYNLGLKIIEKISPYHREHNEKSFTSTKIIRWIKENGGKVSGKTETIVKFAGFVPMFCPDFIAKIMKTIEPIVELPILNILGCAVYVIIAERSTVLQAGNKKE